MLSFCRFSKSECDRFKCWDDWFTMISMLNLSWVKWFGNSLFLLVTSFSKIQFSMPFHHDVHLTQLDFTLLQCSTVPILFYYLILLSFHFDSTTKEFQFHVIQFFKVLNQFENVNVVYNFSQFVLINKIQFNRIDEI